MAEEAGRSGVSGSGPEDKLFCTKGGSGKVKRDKRLERLRELIDTAIACIHTNEDLMVQAAHKHLKEMRNIIEDMELDAIFMQMEAEIDAGKKGEEK